MHTEVMKLSYIFLKVFAASAEDGCHGKSFDFCKSQGR